MDGEATSIAPPGLTFLGVPQEIRMLVYDLLLGDRAFWLVFPHDRTCRSGILGNLDILHTCKQVHREAKRVLRIRTLRINKFHDVDYGLLEKVPQLISQHSRTIESFFIGYGRGSFDALSGRGSSEADNNLLKGNLRDIVAGLPNLQSIVLTCDDALSVGHPTGEIEDQVRQIVRDLQEVLPEFDHITATLKAVSTSSVKEWSTQIKLLKTSGQKTNKVHKPVPMLNGLSY